ncbi:hypothetical protein CJ030_MR8G010105 [Morella rubra]|uniref:Phorbol-ester/DAG-type domain-containing protein n=1 Tax=Morella rubra TaxID=262757 RepID=A0A6A1UPS5_9ROSI|nr:hypothetical protein CJ030_MR8G010105 [Morella rubra]
MQVREKKGQMEVQHIIHEHPLIFNEQLQNDRIRQDCWWCMETSPIVGSNYSCKECSWFILHKSCAESPRELHHPLHPKHPLIPHAHQKWIKCDGCDQGRFWNFSYYCSQCNFNLDPQCASLQLTKKSQCHDHLLTLVQKSLSFSCDACWEEGKGMFYYCVTCSLIAHIKCSFLPLIEPPLTMNTEIHNHPLTLVRSYLSFICDACGKEDKGRFYFCDTCSFVAHQKCTTFPSILEVVWHKHPLNLTYSHQAHWNVCQICDQRVDKNYGIYYCLRCDFLVHLHCAMAEEERDETFVSRLKVTKLIESTNMSKQKDLVHDKSIDLPPYVVKNSKLGVDEIEIDVEIQHFSHEHPLMLTNEPNINEQCDGCVRPIFSPFYSCTRCKFFLHKSCVELPREKRHPLHQHPLILLSNRLHFDDLFRCNACRRYCNGFSYCCEDCNFDLDVKCGSISNVFTHDGHVHRLILFTSGLYFCSGCNSATRYGFSCDNCEFKLDFRCATLQHSASYEPHKHPFMLRYNAEDDSGEYYCDICEEEHDPKLWFYYCADCSYPAHPNCILGKFPYIKFGKTYTVDIHEHLLTMVQKTWDHPLCKICEDPCEDLTLECAKCNFSVHCSCCV